MTSERQTREAIFNSFSERTRSIFSTQKNDIFNNERAFALILSMLTVEKCNQSITVMNQGKEFVSAGVSVVKDPATGQLVSKVLTDEKQLPFINGVKQTFDHATGKMKFEGA